MLLQGIVLAIAALVMIRVLYVLLDDNGRPRR